MISWVILMLFLAPFTGGLIALKSGYSNEKVLKVFLAFAGGYIFSITILHVLPEIFHEGDGNTGLIVLAGFFFQVFISRFSEGAEHGHLHNHHHDHSMALPLGLFISMCLHAFTEGLPLGIMSGAKGDVNQSMSMGIALHELPAAFALMSILRSEHIKRSTVWILLIVYACMAPIGLTLSFTLSSYLPEYIFTRLLAFVAGIFLYVSTTILFENSENHQFSGRKLMAVLGGVAMALLIGYAVG
jgi:zinc and cadmium transporter